MTISSVTAGALIDPVWGNSVAAALNNVKAAEVSAAQATSSLTYGNLATLGPEVTCETGASALVFISALSNNSVGGNSGYISVAVSGASTIAASDAKAVWDFEDSAANSQTMSGVILLTGLTPGTNTFTLKYRTNSATQTFTYRVIAVLPLQA